MTLADFRRLEQRWRDDGLEECADELFVVIQDLEARLEGLTIVDLCRIMGPDGQSMGDCVKLADLAACLTKGPHDEVEGIDG